MRISIRRRLGRIRFSLVVRTVLNVQAVTSRLDDGNHIIMWDFDDVPLNVVEVTLMTAQSRHTLPAIHISRSNDAGGYHAYCLARVSWLRSLEVVAGTQCIDPEYVSMAAWRKRWTLRLSDKGQGVPTFVETLSSEWPEEVEQRELTSWTDYEIWTGPKAVRPA